MENIKKEVKELKARLSELEAQLEEKPKFVKGEFIEVTDGNDVFPPVPYIRRYHSTTDDGLIVVQNREGNAGWTWTHARRLPLPWITVPDDQMEAPDLPPDTWVLCEKRYGKYLCDMLERSAWDLNLTHSDRIVKYIVLEDN